MAASIAIDHSSVSLFETIPADIIAEIKKKRFVILGESHSAGYGQGLEALAASDAKYAVVWTQTQPPEAYTTAHLRFDRMCRTDYNDWNFEGYFGEDKWYTWQAYTTGVPAEKDRVETSLAYDNAHSLTVDVLGFGWCWDMSWHNDVGGDIDPVYQCRWAGSSVDGPDGDRRWGLDSDDTALTNNRVCMNTYLEATEKYIAYCTAQGINTTIIFTTGPVDGHVGENGYQRSIKHQYVRDYVTARGDAVLFDYADILCYDDNGDQNLESWTDGIFKEHIYPVITDLNLGDGSHAHIGANGVLRLAKAVWVMMAKISGWNPDVEEANDMASGISRATRQSVLNHMLKTSTWTAPTHVYVGLYTVAPTAAGGGTELSSSGGTLYARVIHDVWNTATGAEPSVSSNNGVIDFAQAGTSWGALVAFGLFDSLTGGVLLAYGSITKTIALGDIARFLSGELSVAIDETA